MSQNNNNLSDKPRQYRSRQGKSDKRYERDMKFTIISYIGLIITILLILINENI